MSKAVDERLARLLAEAEQRGACLVPPARKDATALHRRKDKGVVVPYAGLFARAAYWDALKPPQRMLHIARALHELHPDWVFCGVTAAVAYGLDVSYALMDTICIAATKSSYRCNSSSGLYRVRRMLLPSYRTKVVSGIPVTTLHGTLFGCLATLPFEEGLAILDSALHIHGISLDSFAVYVEVNGPRHWGIGRVHKAIRYADGRAENGGESKARALMIEEGFVLPELQVEFRDPVESWRVYRVDFYWELDDGRCIAGELDGDGKTSDPALMAGRSIADIDMAERRRESRLTALGLQIMRFTPADVAHRTRLVHLLESYGIPRL